MSDHHSNDAPRPKRLGLLAQFAGPTELVEGARKTTDAGYRRVEAFSPFPLVGVDDALRAKRTILPWIVFAMGLTGSIVGITMQCYMNGTEGSWWLSGYEFLISGKPSFSIPAFIPVMFELTILLSAFGAFFGMILLNGLPRLSNPLFRNERFRDATTDGFFLWVDAADNKFAEAESAALLRSVGAVGVDPVDEEPTGHALPGLVTMLGACALSLAMLPPIYLWATSSTTSSLPRISLFWDMEHQARFNAQAPSTLFADGRAMRAPIEGTVARGGLREDLGYYEGLKSRDLIPAVAPAPAAAARRVRALLVAEGDGAAADAAADDAPAAAPPAPPAEPEADWVTEFPERFRVDAAMMDRGEQRFNIHCAACHGLAGDGDGLVTRRALALEQGTWVQPTSFHSEAVVEQPVGKLFGTITNGIRKMPAYKELITVEDRWAIVLYLQALQRTRQATEAEVPADKLGELKNQK